MKRLCALTCAGLIVAGCAGRDPSPVPAYMPNDAGMSCRELGSEIQRNNDALRVRVDEDAETQNKNIVVGTAAFLLFAPVVLAMDFKAAAETEAHALEQRNRTLTLLASRKRCQPARALTVAEAMAERAARVAARTSETGDIPGVRTPTDQRLHPAAGAAAPTLVPAAAASGPADRQRLRELMDRFLRGEIGKAQYERLRAG